MLIYCLDGKEELWINPKEIALLCKDDSKALVTFKKGMRYEISLKQYEDLKKYLMENQ